MSTLFIHIWMQRSWSFLMQEINRMDDQHYVNYHHHRVLVDAPRTGKCEACRKEIGRDITKTNRHHWKYAYAWKTVREKPSLALENTSELCYRCHKIADALRALVYGTAKDAPEIMKVVNLTPTDMQEFLAKLSRHILNDSHKEL